MTRIRSLFICITISLFGLWHGVSLAQQNQAKPVAENSAGKPIRIVDRILAVVNDGVITQRQLEERVTLVTQQLEKQGTPVPPKDVFSRQMLERLIIEQLHLQFAKDSGLKLDDQDVDRALQRIAQDNQMTVSQLQQALAKDGISFARFRDDIRREMTVARVREREVEGRVTVSESEVDVELAQQASRPQGEDEYQVAHILIRIPEQAGTDVVATRQARANEALAALKKGTDFGQVSASYSDAEEALTGGNLGWRNSAKLPTLFVEALQALAPGELSPVLKSGNGFHILKLLDKRGQGATQNVTQTHARHVLVKVNETTNEADAKNRILQLKSRIDNGADFGEVAKGFSEDLSASKAGDLGWVYPGDMVPEFERNMAALKPNDISQPFLTNFGWHIVQVLERRTTEISAERSRVAARLGLRQRKADEAYQQWLLQLRDGAYVEYRTEDK